MKYTILIFVMVIAVTASGFAAQYYVSNTGTDAPGCTTPATACKTLAYVDGSITLLAGDSVLLQRGGIWNEQLIPPTNGSVGNPISYDAYGTGAAPVLTPIINLAGATWTHNSGNIYTTTLTTPIASPQINNLQLGSEWGRKRSANPGCASAGVILGFGDFCVVYPTLYVYSPNGTPPSTYYSSITPVVGQPSGLAVVSIVGRSGLTFQHIKIQNFDYMGVSVSGSSDNLVFANMEADGMVPYGTTPLGFDVNVSSGSGTSIQFLNDDAHLNYDGFRVDAASAVTVTNCRGYANRDTGVKDNTASGTVITVSYSHFYGNNVAQFPAADVVNGVVGSGNIGLICGAAHSLWPPLPPGMCSSVTAPAVMNFQTYPARFSITVDDVGSSPGTETYINTFATAVPPTFTSRGLHFNAAVVPSYTVDWTSVNNWYAAGNEIDSHSWSHQYYSTNTNPQNATPYPNAPAMTIQYTGSGTAAMMSIAGNMLTTNVTGAAGDNLNVNLALNPLTSAPYTAQQLFTYLQSVAHYSVQQNSLLWTTNTWPLSRPNTHATNLLNVSSQDIKTANYAVLYDQTKLEPDEMASSKSAIQASVPGLTESFYVYPDGIEDPTIEVEAVTAGYTAARGSLAMKGQDNTAASANSLYSNGVNVENITSLGAIQIHGLTQAQTNQMMATLVFRAQAWGVPYGFFTHYNSRGDNMPDISNAEMGYLLDEVTASGGIWLTNTGLAGAITSGSTFSGSTRYIQTPSGAVVNLAVAGANSPTVGAGVATVYPIDLNGENRSLLGSWDIGASEYLSQRYGAAGSGTTYIGAGTITSAANPALPAIWVDNQEATDGLVYTPPGYELNLGTQTWVTGPPSDCTFHLPYWTVGSPTAAGYQSALNDIEACRTAKLPAQACTILDIPPFNYSSANGVYVNQSSSTVASCFNILRSTADSSLPNGQTVCAHGIQDNLATSTDPGLINADCAGDNLAYQLGTTVTTIPAGTFTLANGTLTNTSNYDDVQYMWTVECTGTNCVPFKLCSPLGSGSGAIPACTSTTLAPDRWLIEDMEARMSVGNTGSNNIVSMAGASETLVSQIPAHIHFRKDWAHGDWTSLTAGANSVSTAFGFQCTYCSIVDSQVSQALRPGAEGHAVLANGTTYKINHNWFEGQSSGIFSGGFSGAGPSVGGVPFQDVEMRRNRLTFPYAWLGQSPIPVGNTHWAGQNITRKNCSEYKEGERILRDGNICENVDNSGAQSGTVTVINVRNSSVGFGTNYQSTINDVTYSNEIDRNACEGAEIAARSAGVAGSGGGVSFPIKRLLLSNWLEYNISHTANPGCGGSNGFGDQMSSPGETWQGTITENSAGTAATFVATCSVDGGDCPAGPPSVGFQNTDISASDPVFVVGCTSVTAFNMPTQVLSSHTVALGVGPLAANGTNPASLTVTYPWAATANAVDSSGNCTITNIQGGPQNVTINHHTLITDAGLAIGNGNTLNSGPNFQVNHLFTNSIMLGGGWNDSVRGEGSLTETFNYDASSMTADYLVWPTRTAASYTEYGNDALAVDPSGCSGAGCHPPATMLFPATPYCTGSTPTAACVGFTGAMSTSSMPLALNDYHGYALISGSTFKAGGTGQARDGTDMGVNIPALDAAQTLNQYAGSGPYPDATVSAPMEIQILAPGPGQSMTTVNTYLKPSPYVAGIVNTLWWSCSDQDGTSGHYTWSAFDARIASDGWAAAGKKLHIVLGAVTYGGTDAGTCDGGGGYGTSGIGNYGVPTYVWTALGSSNYVTCGTQQVPNYYAAAYQTNYRNWIAATLAHFAASSYASNIEYIRIAPGKGGEDTPTSTWDTAGQCVDGGGNNTFEADWHYELNAPPDANSWLTYLQNFMTWEAGLGSRFQLMVSITPMGYSGQSQATVGNFLAPVATGLGIGFGTQGLMASDVNNVAGCGGNWCNLFAASGGKVPLETQTFYQSCATTNESGTCPSMAITTGPLDPLLAWAASQGATSFEMYYEDACAMLCPGYSVAGYAAYPQAGYLAALLNVVGGD